MRALTTLGISSAFVLSLGLITAGYLAHVGPMRMVGVLAATFFGVGAAPLQLSGRCGLATKLGVAGLIGLSVLLLGGTVMTLGSGWHPARAAVVFSVVAAAAHGAGCIRAVRVLRKCDSVVSRAGLCSAAAERIVGLRSGSRRRAPDISAACTLAGTALWCYGVAAVGHVIPGVAGFLPRISVLWYAGLILLLAAIALARHKSEAHAMFALLSLIAALTLTPALAYGMPRTQSAAKHIYLVQQAMSVHYFDRTAGIYQTFSGFFSGIAWVCEVAHFSDVIGLASYWPFIIGLVGLAELRFFFGQLNFSRYRIWVAITLVVLVNSIGADYFSPQSVGFVMGLGVFGLVLGRHVLGINAGVQTTALVFAGCALAVTHELSPYIVGGVLLVLVVLRVVQPWYVPITVIVPAVAWALLNHRVVSGYVSLGDLGNLSNLAPPKTTSTPGLHRLPIVGESSHALLLGLLVLIALAFIGFIQRRRSKEAWAIMISAGVGVLLTVANPYGNEGIFRAALFGIPWLAVLALAAIKGKAPRWAPGAAALCSIGLLGTFLISMFGLDNAGVIRPGEIQALSYWQAHAPADSFLLGLAYGDPPLGVTYPENGHYAKFGTVLTPAEAELGGPNAADVRALTEDYVRYARSKGMTTAGQLYAFWSPGSAAYSVDYGLETLGQAQRWRSLIAASPYWRQEYAHDGTYLFRLIRTPQPGQPSTSS